ncbi:MAG: thiamine-phosphate kinase [Candidatus Omnitrophica bacterium]|nr:thiamine-phosphate kinase [Candidatus Omnitrophota bacterium]MDD5574000.1 thiamine-phosphate kinase [Candidatus Omnitrophota bacterium]
MDAYLKNIKEWRLVCGLAARFKTADPDVIVGIGDDAAVIRGPRGAYGLLTADMLVESVHFRKGEDLKKVGYKAMAVSVSDIAAMGGVPRFALVSAGLPRQGLSSSVRALFDGIRRCARDFDISVVGGDTNRSKRLVVDVFMMGEVERKNLVLRSGARRGDVICVSGPLGGSRSGRHLSFIPRLKEARFLVRRFDVHAMMDLSDGLSMDLSRLCEASRLGAVVFEEDVPRNPGVKTLAAALGDGEDYELLFTLPQKEAARLSDACSRREAPFRFYPVGRMTGAFRGVRIRGAHGRMRKLSAPGFRHF